MGQILSEPVTEKHSSQESCSRMAYGLSAMQGWRLSMEDAHTAILDLLALQQSPTQPSTTVTTVNDPPSFSFFAVFDGHGGDRVAKFSGGNLHRVLLRQPDFAEGKYHAALTKTFLEMDVIMRSLPEMKGDPSGATAVTCLVTPDRLYCGKAHAMSIDHKPSLASERERIIAAGGFLDFGRVNGNLALSRALGDFDFKNNTSLPAEEQMVTANPEIMEHPLSEEVDFIVLACDGIPPKSVASPPAYGGWVGIWDCMSNEQVVAFVHTRAAEGKDLTVICEEMIDHCLAPDAFVGATGCDNMSVIIVGLYHGKSKEEWVAQLRSTLGNLNPQDVQATSPNSRGAKPGGIPSVRGMMDDGRWMMVGGLTGPSEESVDIK